MKVLITVTSANRRSSMTTNTYNEQEIGLARALLHRGHTCDIAYYAGNIEAKKSILIDENQVNIYFLKGKDFLKTAVFKNYDDVYKQYDILMPISYDHYETLHIAKKHPNKTVVYHGTYYATFNKRYNLKCALIDRFVVPIYIRLNTCFVTKNKLAAEFLNKKGIKNTKVIGVGFDEEQMRSKELLSSDVSKKMERLKEAGKKIILYIGRLEPRRNILFLLDTFNEVIKTDGNVVLVIIGNGKQKYKQKCRERIEKYNISNKVLYVEKMEQNYLPLVYKLADLFLLPTSYEIFGMVLLEAMYFGLPVLTTLNGGSDILIKNEETGYIIPEFDINKWKGKISEILEKDNSELCEKAHNVIVERYTWEALAPIFIELFEKKIEKQI